MWEAQSGAFLGVQPWAAEGHSGPRELGPRHWEEECGGENRLPPSSSGPGVNILGSGTGASDAREQS